MIQEKQISGNTETGKGEIIIHIKDLYKRFGDNQVLNGFNLKLYKGENFVFM